MNEGVGTKEGVFIEDWDGRTQPLKRKTNARGCQKVTQHIWGNYSVLQEQEGESPCQEEARSGRRNDLENRSSYNTRCGTLAHWKGRMGTNVLSISY